MPFENILDAACSIVAEYGLVKVHSGPAFELFVGVSISGNFNSDVGKYLVSMTLGTDYWFPQKQKLSEA